MNSGELAMATFGSLYLTRGRWRFRGAMRIDARGGARTQRVSEGRLRLDKIEKNIAKADS